MQYNLKVCIFVCRYIYVCVYVCVYMCMSISIMEEHFLATKVFQHAKKNLANVCKHTERVALLKAKVIFQNFVQEFLLEFWTGPAWVICAASGMNCVLCYHTHLWCFAVLSWATASTSLYRLLLPPAVKSWCHLTAFQIKALSKSCCLKTPIGFWAIKIKPDFYLQIISLQYLSQWGFHEICEVPRKWKGLCGVFLFAF